MKKLIRVTTVPLSLDKLLGKQLSYMNGFYDVTAVSADGNRLREVAEKYGVKHRHIEMTRQITPFRDLLSVWQMFRFFKEVKPEIVHSHTPKAGLVGMMAAFFARVPVRMHTVAGLPLLETKGAKRIVLNLVETITYAFATKVYPNSFALKKIIVETGFCAPEKLKVLGNGSSSGIDTGHFSPEKVLQKETDGLRMRLGIDAGDFVFVFVGRLVRDKGINELVAAFCSVQEKFGTSQTVKLLLVGPLEQNLDPVLPATLAEIQHNPGIRATGYQDDVRPFLALADTLVFPSYREGFPNVVLQAGAMGLPSVVTDINGCNEIITHGENGLIIPVKDAESLSEAMVLLKNDLNLYNTLKENARQNIIQHFGQQRIWDAIRKEYEDNLKG